MLIESIPGERWRLTPGDGHHSVSATMDDNGVISFDRVVGGVSLNGWFS